MIPGRDPIVAVGLLTQRDLEVLGQGLRYVFPLDAATDFSALLRRIDEAERQECRRPC
jgi:hypothetical protein